MDMAEEPTLPIGLKWTPLAGAGDLAKREDSCPTAGCVYVWGFMLSVPGHEEERQQFVPYYVGKTRNPSCRLKEHLGNLLGGRHTLYHQAILHRVGDFAGEPVCQPTGLGKVYTPTSPYEFMRFHRSPVLREHARFAVDHFHFTSAPLDTEAERAYCEKAVACRIGKHRLGTLVKGCADWEGVRLCPDSDRRVLRLLEGVTDHEFCTRCGSVIPASRR